MYLRYLFIKTDLFHFTDSQQSRSCNNQQSLLEFLCFLRILEVLAHSIKFDYYFYIKVSINIEFFRKLNWMYLNELLFILYFYEVSHVY